MTVEGSAAYDETPYPGLSYGQTHPDRLATIATLLGMAPAPVEGCRLLEIGCATGGNLLPMAYGLPNSQLVGIDYAPRQIAQAEASVSALGLDNVRFLAADVRDLRDDLGTFDYVVAHGVYSWVPSEVRDALLAACQRLLAPQGVAYISYNTFPGWHLLGVVRGLMRYRTRGIEGGHERARAAREVTTMLRDVVGTDSAYGAFLDGYVQAVMPKLAGEPASADALLLHDEMEDVNEPVYFHEFVAHAQEHRLRYLGEASLSSVLPDRLPKETVRRLLEVARDPVEFEQYMDFVKNRTFRETLLCREEVEASRGVRASAVTGLRLSSRARPATEGLGPAMEDAATFRGLDGADFTTNHPLTKAAFMELRRMSPQTLAFRDLAEAAAQSIGLAAEGREEHLATLAANMLRAYGYSDSLVALHSYAPSFTLEPGAQPVASAAARLQAGQGSRVTNMRHERVTLEEPARRLLPLLDGEHARPALAARLAELQVDLGATPGDRDAELDGMLQFFARAALLIR